ncbi:hypothetical protein [uncultured Treponema sp.]|uniref:hypothetical protein n=1 Tax=uncultured Treponema sp. TaxID=162155 RepID=UPI0025E1F4CD|nr:hypothetical protein [uncultured Treponema sp.]
MFTATKIETEILKILNQAEPLKEEQIIEEIRKSSEKNSVETSQVIQNALEGCIAKGFASQASGGKFKITEEGKKQL